jgi:hypothetical protein
MAGPRKEKSTMNRPMLNLSTSALCERILSGDAAAAREAVIRLDRGVRPYNARKLRSVLGDVLVDTGEADRKAAARAKMGPAPKRRTAPAPAPVATPEISPEVLAQAIALVLSQQAGQASSPAPVPAPAPAPVPRPRPVRKASAATIFNKRVYALAEDGERVRKANRATKLAKREGLTREDVAALSDEQCLALVATPV